MGGRTDGERESVWIDGWIDVKVAVYAKSHLCHFFPAKATAIHN